ncbi:MAG: response regulator [Gammaproteobacteria bacterium]
MGTVSASTGRTAVLATVLCVDDEPNILAALRRLLVSRGYGVMTAQCATAALDLLTRETADVVISDMRMPEMDGAQLLAQVARSWPDTVRILLTGYADLTSTVAAINEGSIYRYISKPWEDNDLLVAVRRAVEFQAAERERRRLLQLTIRQNLELTDLNQNLENKVRARTEEIRQTADFLEMAYAELKQSYRNAVRVFAHLVELREGGVSGHGRRVAGLAAPIGTILGLSEDEQQSLWDAALLHDIGKIGLPDELVQRPYNALAPKQRDLLNQHPAMGQAALMSLTPLDSVGAIIRSHHERFDGLGYPDRRSGADIPLGARILAVTDNFDGLQTGALLGRQLSVDEARAHIERGSGTRFDPKVVDAFTAVLREQQGEPGIVSELNLPAEELQAGMVVAQDIQTKTGMLLLAEGHELTPPLIDRIRAFEHDAGQGLVVRVRATQRKALSECEHSSIKGGD